MNSRANSAPCRLLVLDDDSLIHESLTLILPDHWEIVSAMKPTDVPKDGIFHAAFVDMHLTKNTAIAEGPDAIAEIRKRFPLIEVYAMSGDLTIQLMEKALEKGARKFLAKPLNADEILEGLEKIEALWALRQSGSLHRSTKTFKWLGDSETSQAVLYNIASLRGERAPILIEGDTGTGKEVVANLLNQQEAGRPFLAVNLGAIPENLFESEFFGHIRGAFTGADSLKIGLAEAANGGDLFLDEIEALPLSQQAKLLRFLESGEVRRVGAKEVIHVKVRIIAASNQVLSEMVEKGQFREDLLFRLAAHRVQLPALRERSADIPELTKSFFKSQARASTKMLSAEALLVLQSHSWPGNVRELRRVCEQLALTSPLPIIRDIDVQKVLGGKADSPKSARQLDRGLTALVEDFEKEVLIEALALSENDVDRAAELLQISRSNFYKKMKDYVIEAAR